MIKTIRFLLLSFIAMLITAYFWGQNPEKRNYDYMPDLAYSFAYRAQSANPFWPNNQTQKNPVAHSIAIGTPPLHFNPQNPDQELQRAAKLLINSHKERKREYVQRGQEVFQNFCRPCHGAGGKGDGAVTKKGFPPPPSLLTGRVKTFTDGQLFYIITYGFKNMASYKYQITREDRWNVIEYVRKLQERQP